MRLTSKLCSHNLLPLFRFRQRAKNCNAANAIELEAIKLSIISILTLVLLYSTSELRKWRYEELFQNYRTYIRQDLGIGIGTSSFDLSTISWKTGKASSIAYQTLLIISKTGSGDELFEYFGIQNFTDPREKYATPGAVVTVKTVLKIRKLILFTVNEINLKLENQGNCMKFWANPLNIHEIEEIGIKGKPERYYRIQFRIQPGHLVLEASIKEDGDYLKKPFTVGIQNELELISAKFLELDPQYRLSNSNCIKSTAAARNADGWLKLCLCSNTQLARITQEIRNLAHSRDPEWYYWPPTAPMFITNYFSYGLRSFYLISPIFQLHQRFCNPNVSLLIVIPSASINYEKRMEIRETYGSPDEMAKYNFGLLFFLGSGVGLDMKSLTKEISEFDDIVIGDFLDSYTNLTLKTLSVYNWIYTFCMKTESLSYPSWILKADDDMLINVEVAIQIAKANSHVPLLGFLRSGNVRIGANNFKGYTPRYLYIADWYPTFYAGPTYMIQTSWIPKYLQASLTTPLLHNEDVYVTGLLPLQLGSCPTKFPVEFDYYDARESSCYLKQSISSFGGIYHEKYMSIRSQWDSLISTKGSECKELLQPKVTESITSTKGNCVFSPTCPHSKCKRS